MRNDLSPANTYSQHTQQHLHQIPNPVATSLTPDNDEMSDVVKPSHPQPDHVSPG
ncbi:hypothetical protein QN395_07430 [Undibacterium sp. RTI2.2]|nr:hypothetical protein [Undibacterium sp. RTI2.2]